MPDTQEKRSRVLALVFTDLADSTGLKTRQGDTAIEALISRHASYVKRLAADCGGRIIDWAGDGCFLTFETSSSAVLFALRLQQAHADESDLPGVRIGIHMGEVTETVNDARMPHVTGLAVDLASRISGLARPGQVLMSAAVYDSARQRIGVESLGQPILWQAHGTYALKGFDKELEIGEAGMKHIAPLTAPTSGDKAKLVRRAKQPAGQPKPARVASSGGRRLSSSILGAILVLALVGVAYLASRSRGGNAVLPSAAVPSDSNAPITKIAVLPFKNISGDSQQEYFVDGMTEALISELAKIKSIKVISRTSAMHYKDTDKTLPEIARELGVDGLVEGSAMKAGNEVRITAQLIRAATDDHLWAESYTETLENVLKVQAQVALAITGEIKAVVTPDERSRVASAKTVNIAAYELYVEARRYWSMRTPDGFQRAHDLFTQSIKIDPNFALGHAGLADTYYTQAEYSMLSSDEACRLGREEAEKALALDPDVGEAYATLAVITLTQTWDWAGSEKSFLKAIELSPNYATAHHWYALHLAGRGRRAEAVEELRIANQLDPNSPVIGAIFADLLSATDQTQEAFEVAERFARQYPDNWRVQSALGNLNFRAGKYDAALVSAERMNGIGGNFSFNRLYKAMVFARLGQTEDARKLIEDTIAGTEVSKRAPLFIAQSYAVLGDRDRAIEWLTKAADTHDVFAWRTKIFPEFDALESDPRYQALLRRMNFPEVGTRN